ncbi:hypothetical protein TcasGA2_TC031881, partial [Tribolium castaneum]
KWGESLRPWGLPEWGPGGLSGRSPGGCRGGALRGRWGEALGGCRNGALGGCRGGNLRGCQDGAFGAAGGWPAAMEDHEGAACVKLCFEEEELFFFFLRFSPCKGASTSRGASESSDSSSSERLKNLFESQWTGGSEMALGASFHKWAENPVNVDVEPDSEALSEKTASSRRWSLSLMETLESLTVHEVCTKEIKEPPKCANCNGPHTANYRGCPQFPKLQKTATPRTTAPAKVAASKAAGPKKAAAPKPTAAPKVVASKANPTATNGKGGAKKTAKKTLSLRRSSFESLMGANQLIQNSFQVAFWNANGLRAARDELEEFVDRLQLDIVLVCETKLQPQTTDLKIRGFTLHRADRGIGPGGGRAIFVSNRIKHSVLATPDLRNMEAVGNNVATANGPLRLFACYNRPQIPILEEDLQTLFDGNTPTIAAGDFNAKHINWGSRRSNRNGNILNGFTDQHLDISESVERIENWCRRWLINVNPDKSQALLLARRRVNPDGFVRMFNADVPWSDQVKYLAFNAPWFVRNNQLHREAKMPTMEEFFRETAERAFSKAEAHPNPLVREAVDYDENGPSRCKRPRMALL